MPVAPQHPFRAPLPYLFALVALGACAGPDPRPLELDRLAREVAARGDLLGRGAAALELADLRALPFERPVLEEAPAYDRGAFWQACALAFNGELRSARRRWAEAGGRARAGGAAAATELEIEQTGFEAGERETWMALTFDVLGLFDAGRSAAARDLAQAEARTAWADVEGAAWAARIAVDRARAELGAALEQGELLAELLASSSPSAARAELLFERGRLTEGDRARLFGMVHEVQGELGRAQLDVLEHRRALADAAGLPPGAPALDGPTRATLDDLLQAAEPPSLPEARELLDRSPELRRARLEYAVAEAVLRDEVAETRLGLRLGPALQVGPDDTLPGGVLAIDFPRAHALSGRVAAAHEARERMREELEEALRASLARIDASQGELAAMQRELAEHALPRAAETDVAWRAASARFAVDPLAADALGTALRDRAMALLALSGMRRDVVLAWLDLQAVIGPAPRPLPGEEALAAGEVAP